MFKFLCEYRFGSHTIYMWDHMAPVSFVEYSINEEAIIIHNINRTIYANRHYDSTKHFGSDIFNQLLKDLQSNNIDFNMIKGKLAFNDAIVNWEKSIPFYADFPKHLNSELKYKLKFHLYNNPNYTDEKIFPDELSKRQLFLNDFRHIHIVNSSDASFIYEIFFLINSKTSHRLFMVFLVMCKYVIYKSCHV